MAAFKAFRGTAAAVGVGRGGVGGGASFSSTDCEGVCPAALCWGFSDSAGGGGGRGEPLAGADAAVACPPLTASM